MNYEDYWQRFVGGSGQTPQEFARLSHDAGESIDEALESYADACPELFRDDAIDPAEVYETLRGCMLREISGDSVVSVADVAEWLGLDARRVQQLAKSGTLAGRQIGRTWVIDREAVLAYKPAARGWERGRARKTAPCAACELDVSVAQANIHTDSPEIPADGVHGQDWVAEHVGCYQASALGREQYLQWASEREAEINQAWITVL